MSSWTTLLPGLAGLAGGAVDAALGPRLSVLIFHRVLRQPDPLFPGEMHASRFEELVRLLARHFRVMPMGEAATRLTTGTLPRRAVAITFDDGYADNAEIATPILASHGVSGTFFIASGFLDGGWMWNDIVIESLRHSARERIDLDFLGLPPHALVTPQHRRQAIDAVLPKLKYRRLNERSELLAKLSRETGSPSLGPGPMMSVAQLQRMHRAGMEIGAHTSCHPILALESDERAHLEIASGRERLQQLVDGPVDLFAYPNGQPGKDYLTQHVDMVRGLGFRHAVTTAAGPVTSSSDPFQWPRFTPWDNDASRWLMRMVAVKARRTPACVV